MSTPRGIRNNNPGNIRWGSDWKGLVPLTQRTDKSFCQFTSPEYGIRAIARVLRNYTKHPGMLGVGDKGIDTVREVISRWAPPNENDTEAYIRAVAAKLNVAPNDHIDVFNTQVLVGLIEAIIQHENGQQPYKENVIVGGISLA